jgi:hypothetical protein
MAKSSPKTALTSRLIGQLLPQFMTKLGKSYKEKPMAIIEAWPTIVGPSLAPMTQALSFREGILYVAVNNATLYSLLSAHDKPRILQNLREKFPQTVIKTIVFRRQ